MDNLWEQFCISGKVSDYLLYRNSINSDETEAVNDADDN